MLSYSILKRLSRETKQFVRYKNPPDHWSVLRKKVHPKDKALTHMDDFYKQVFDDKWLKIRKAMLGKQKYVAVINNYGDDRETMQELELTGALNMRTLFNLEKGYLKEERLKNMNNKTMEDIFRLDEELDRKIESKIEDDSKESTATEKLTAKDFSLASSLEKAKYDTRRLIDLKDPLSTETLHEFLPATEIKGKEDFIPESTHYKLYDQQTNFAVKMEKEYDIPFPDHLNIYCYERDNKSDFEGPKRGQTDVYNYYLMDGGSILPVLALDLKPGNKFLDMCSAPGGKSLLALQTFFPDLVVSNDSSLSRLNRVESVFRQFLYDFEEKWVKTGKIRLSQRDGRFISEEGFDRILVDVPCTTDRHSLHENENNIFKPSRIKERLKLPELQKELLVNALKLVQAGGIVVYSTCSLSPIQNDGVVHVALKQIWEETNMEIVVKDLSPALMQTRSVFELADKGLLRYGHLVLPKPSQNYGPTYFCKLQKIKPQISSPEDNSTLKEVLELNLPKIRAETTKIPWRELKHLKKPERKELRRQKNNEPEVDKKNYEGLRLGVNAVTKLLETNTAGSVLIAGDVQPRLMVQHIVDMAVLHKIPILVFNQLRDVLKSTCGVSSACIAISKNVASDSKPRLIKETVEIIFEKCPLPVNHINFKRSLDSVTSEKKKDIKDTTQKSKKLKVDEETIQNSLLLEKVGTEPVFVPPKIIEKDKETKEVESIKNDFIPLSLSQSDQINIAKGIKKAYKHLKVKRIKGDINRNKKKIKHLKKAKKGSV